MRGVDSDLPIQYVRVRVRAMRLIAIAIAIASASAGLSACQPEPFYLGEGDVYQVALSEATMPALQSDDAALFIVETRAELPVREPSAEELAALMSGASAYAGLPFPRLPWVKRDDCPLQVDFTLTNLDQEPHDIDVILNGANEFHEYVPIVVSDENMIIPLHAQWEHRYDLGPEQRLTATVREEELDEMAVDLATVVNGAPNSDEIVYFENNSQTDPRARPYIPAVIPGLVAIRLGMRATGAANVLLEASVRVRDDGDRLAHGDEPRMQIMPQLFETIVPEN